MNYKIKNWEEFAWFMLVSIMTALGTALIGFDVNAITDVKTWALAVGIGALRVIVAAFLNYMATLGKNESE